MSHRCASLVVVLLVISGCGQTSEFFSVSSKIKDPVAPPPPERVAAAEETAPTDAPRRAPAGETLHWPIEPAGGVDGPAGNRGGSLGAAGLNPESLLLVRVGGRPIFLVDVLQSIGAKPITRDDGFDETELAMLAQLQQMLERPRATPLGPGLDRLVERALLLQQAGRELNEQQMTMIKDQAGKEFEKRLRELKQQLRVGTNRELDVQLRKQGLSLAALRQTHEDNYISQQFLQSRVAVDADIARREMVEYYKANIGEFTEQARAKWQHLPVAVAPGHRKWQSSTCTCNGCREARRYRAELVGGADFDALARRHSQGPHQQDGGRWDWTPQGNLADAVLDAALFSLPVGEISPVVEGADGLHIVRVLEKQEGGVKPFRSVQSDIRNKLRQEKLHKAAGKYLDELVVKGNVEYMRPEFMPRQAPAP